MCLCSRSRGSRERERCANSFSSVSISTILSESKTSVSCKLVEDKSSEDERASSKEKVTFFRRPFLSRALKQDFTGFTVDKCLRSSDVVGDDEVEDDSNDDPDPDLGKEDRDEEGFDSSGDPSISALETSLALLTSLKAIARGKERDKAVDISRKITSLKPRKCVWRLACVCTCGP